MNDGFGPLNWVSLLPLGVALLVSVRIVFGERVASSDDALRRVLVISGWLLVIVGIVGFVIGMTFVFSVALLVVMFVVLLSALLNFGRSERQALLWVLAVAAEKGIPLDQAAFAFAADHTNLLGRRSDRLARLLAAGRPLPEAIDLARLRQPVDALVAIRVGHDLGQLGPLLRESLERDQELELSLRSVLERCFYILVLVISCFTIGTFLLWQIVPMFQKMLMEFEVATPFAMRFLVPASKQLIVIGPIVLSLSLLLLLAASVAVLYYVGLLPRNLPLLSRLALPMDRSAVLRALSWSVRGERALPATIESLAQTFPRGATRHRLRSAARRIAAGQHWCDALRRVRLMQAMDVAVVKAAERTGNVAWALEEMADSNLRRCLFRLRSVLHLVFPAAIIAIGGAVFVLGFGVFAPLITILEKLP